MGIMLRDLTQPWNPNPEDAITSPTAVLDPNPLVLSGPVPATSPTGAKTQPAQTTADVLGGHVDNFLGGFLPSAGEALGASLSRLMGVPRYQGDADAFDSTNPNRATTQPSVAGVVGKVFTKEVAGVVALAAGAVLAGWSIAKA